MDEDLARHALKTRLLAIGIDRFMTSKFVNGKRRPSLETATRIERAIGIPASAWADGPPLREVWAQITKRSE